MIKIAEFGDQPIKSGTDLNWRFNDASGIIEVMTTDKDGLGKA
jgi:hypothetical protein